MQTITKDIDRRVKELDKREEDVRKMESIIANEKRKMKEAKYRNNLDQMNWILEEKSLSI